MGSKPFPSPCPMRTLAPFARPLYVMLKPVGAMCNMRCPYCYYLPTADRRHPSRDASARQRQRHGQQPTAVRMSETLLEQFTRQYIEAQTMPEVLFTWHGGEPTLQSLHFYRKAIELQRRYAQGRQVANSLQTNGTLLDDEWCQFLAENHFLVGLSIDGPRPLHDRYRLTADGRPTFDAVLRAVSLLQKHGVEWNAMATVNSLNADHPLPFYRFFKSIRCSHLQLTPVVGAEGAVTPEQWGRFLCAVFDEWVPSDVGTVYVSLFDCTLANWVGATPAICAYADECGHAAVMEADGDVYSCDHFVRPEHCLGNLHQQSLVEMLYGPQQQRFSLLKHQALPRQCRECDVLFACHGECPKNRTATDRYGNPGLNSLCEGYRQFYHHAAPFFDFMARELAHQRPPANVMQVIRSGLLPAELLQADK